MAWPPLESDDPDIQLSRENTGQLFLLIPRAGYNNFQIRLNNAHQMPKGKKNKHKAYTLDFIPGGNKAPELGPNNKKICSIPIDLLLPGDEDILDLLPTGEDTEYTYEEWKQIIEDF